MLVARCAVLAVLLATRGAVHADGECPKLEVPDGVLTRLPGTSINLTCPGHDLEKHSPVHWKFHSDKAAVQIYRTGLESTLHLSSLQPNNSGNYSCFRAHKLAGTVRLLVEAPPEEPQISCFRKNFVSKVICEWRPQTIPSPATEAKLLVKNIRDKNSNTSQAPIHPCWYVAERQTFSCQLPVSQADNSLYLVSLCLANTAGSRRSSSQSFYGYEIVQPDPPANVTVTAVDGNPLCLRVIWRDPPSWNSYYWLKFELRYRAEKEDTFRIWKVPEEYRYNCIITDAIRGLTHVVQIRMQEEFGNGQWSQWSPEVRGTPWTDPKTIQVETRTTQMAPVLPVTEPNHENIIPVNFLNTTSLPRQDVPLPAFLVAGGSLTFGTLLCIGIILRLRKSWKLKAHKEGKTNAQLPYSPGQYIPGATLILVPLISHVKSPSNFGPDIILRHSQPEFEQSTYDISNRSYFLSR